jgi:phage terminase small subunit
MRAKTKQDQQPAQIGGGDPRVVAHPGFRKIPDCLFPLRTKEAKREYNTLARVLFDAGHMTVAKHRALSSYCMQFDNISAAPSEGKTIRGSWVAQMDKARNSLGLDDLDKPVASPADAKTNKFARAGFASRRR